MITIVVSSAKRKVESARRKHQRKILDKGREKSRTELENGTLMSS